MEPPPQDWPKAAFFPRKDDAQWRTRDKDFVKYPLIDEFVGTRQVRLYSPKSSKYRLVDRHGHFVDLTAAQIRRDLAPSVVTPLRRKRILDKVVRLKKFRKFQGRRFSF